MVKICNYCGNEYNIPKSQEARSKFCSDSCFRNSKNTQELYNCDYCNKPFMVRKTKINKRLSGSAKHLCCSADCSRNIQKPTWDDICKIFQSKGYVLKSNKYTDNRTKLEYICLKHQNEGSQFITYNNIKNGYGCRYCGKEAVAESKRLTFEDVKMVFSRNDMDLLEGQTYKNTSEVMAYICRKHKEHGIQYMSTSNAYRNHCPHCNKSKGEDIISRYLFKNNIEFISQYRFDDLRGLRGGRLSYDFYLPDINLLIEYQGEFHDGTVSDIQTPEAFKAQQEHDRRKREYARIHSINLLEIWYYDFANIENILHNTLINT